MLELSDPGRFTLRLRRLTTCFLLLFSAVPLLSAAPMHPVERHLRVDFPSVSIQSTATFEDAEEIIGSRFVPGLRARFPQSSAMPERVILTYPRFYGDPLVAALGEQRVVLRAVNACATAAETVNGTLIFREPYPSVDAVEVPHNARSEEILLLRDERAPLAYDYEIVEMRGVAAVVLDRGAVSFVSGADPVANAMQINRGRFDQLPAMLQIDRPWVVDAVGRRSEAHARWSLIGAGATPAILRLTVSTDGLTYPLVVDPSFSATGRLINDRYSHTATLLQNGKVLVAGGIHHDGSYLREVELYDPAASTFSATGPLVFPRTFHTATLLSNGQVLIAGGEYGDPFISHNHRTAELYDPATGTFSLTGSLNELRYSATATLLPNGKVLVAGGNQTDYGDPLHSLAAAELYDPATGTFNVTGSMPSARDSNTATLLPNGKVLIAGGFSFSGGALSSALLYDPASGTFSSTGSMITKRFDHTATLLPNGKVLITTGWTLDVSTGVTGPVSSAELYDPSSGTFSATGSLARERRSARETPLSNGNVLITGGSDDSNNLSTAELYDAASGTFSLAGSTAFPRGSHTATILPNGKVLIAGGRDNSNNILFAAELYDPSGAAAPTIAGINPNRGPTTGAQSVTVTGTNLTGATVVIGGNAATVTGTSAAAVTFTTPTHAAGVVNVTLTTAGGSATVNGGYTYVLLPAIAFTASPSAIAAGQSSTLSWTVTNANTVLIDQGIGARSLSGSVAVSPGVTTTYTLSASNADGTALAQTTVSILGPRRRAARH